MFSIRIAGRRNAVRWGTLSSEIDRENVLASASRMLHLPDLIWFNPAGWWRNPFAVGETFPAHIHHSGWLRASRAFTSRPFSPLGSILAVVFCQPNTHVKLMIHVAFPLLAAPGHRAARRQVRLAPHHRRRGLTTARETVGLCPGPKGRVQFLMSEASL